MEVFVKHAHALIEVLENERKEAKDIDLQRLFSKFTLESIGEIGFGVDLGCFQGGRATDVPFERNFDIATHIVGDRFVRYHLLRTSHPD